MPIRQLFNDHHATPRKRPLRVHGDTGPAHPLVQQLFADTAPTGATDLDVLARQLKQFIGFTGIE